MPDVVRAGGKNPFEYRLPHTEQIQRIKTIRKACEDAYIAISENIAPSRERSLAITKLEEVTMWANKAVLFETGDQVEDRAPEAEGWPGVGPSTR